MQRASTCSTRNRRTLQRVPRIWPQPAISVPACLFLLANLLTCRALPAAEPAPPYPLWDGHESVETYAKKVNLPPTKSFDLGGGVTLDLVLIPAGQFMMGTPRPAPPAATVRASKILMGFGLTVLTAMLVALILKIIYERRLRFSLRWLILFTASSGLVAGGYARWLWAEKEEARYSSEMAIYSELSNDEKPAHSVTITQPFYMGKFTVTQTQYEAVTGNNPSDFKGYQLPVEMVSRDDAVGYCAKLNERLKAQLPGGMAFQLPTESQWEFACRAGTTTAFNTGETISTDDANLDGSKLSPYLRGAGTYRRRTTPVNSFKPNAFGLYDMHGNVLQWCRDKYTAEYPKINVIAPFNDSEDEDKGVHRILRGGSWCSIPRYCRASFRFVSTSNNRMRYSGFRVVVVATSKTP